MFAIGCQFPPNILGRFFELNLKEGFGRVVSRHLPSFPKPDEFKALSVSGSQLVTMQVSSNVCYDVTTSSRYVVREILKRKIV